MKKWILGLGIAAALCVVISCVVDLVFPAYEEPPTYEVCTRSHIKKIPVTGLDGKTTLVPAERCDHYKIVENQ